MGFWLVFSLIIWALSFNEQLFSFLNVSIVGQSDVIITFFSPIICCSVSLIAFPYLAKLFYFVTVWLFISSWSTSWFSFQIGVMITLVCFVCFFSSFFQIVANTLSVESASPTFATTTKPISTPVPIASKPIQPSTLMVSGGGVRQTAANIQPSPLQPQTQPQQQQQSQQPGLKNAVGTIVLGNQYHELAVVNSSRVTVPAATVTPGKYFYTFFKKIQNKNKKRPVIDVKLLVKPIFCK